MSATHHFTGSIWFLALVALLVSLGSQVLVGALPVTSFDWIDNEDRSGLVVLVAGETSFWRGDAVIRGISFGLGALIASLLASSNSWRLIATLVLISVISTACAQFPRPANPVQLTVWAASAPVATLLVSVLIRAWRGHA